MDDNILNFDEINKAVYVTEKIIAKNLLDYLAPEYCERKSHINDRATEIVETIRNSKNTDSPIESLLKEY